jgi:dTDP-glucose 4,6-dehydratase
MFSQFGPINYTKSGSKFNFNTDYNASSNVTFNFLYKSGYTARINNEKIPVYGQGLQTREWIYVIDNCWALITALQSGTPGDIYNVSTGYELANIELVQKICNLMEETNKETHSLISFVEDRKGHDFRYAINSDKLKSLGWSPKFKFTESLATTVSWFKSNKNWWFKSQ